MARRKIVAAHEIAKLSSKYLLLYFLWDLGIKSAKAPAIEAWHNYIHSITVIMDDGYL
jgi:hypothetical protein